MEWKTCSGLLILAHVPENRAAAIRMLCLSRFPRRETSSLQISSLPQSQHQQLGCAGPTRCWSPGHRFFDKLELMLIHKLVLQSYFDWSQLMDYGSVL